MDKKQKLNSRHIDAFLDMMFSERGASANTVDSYKRDLADFSSFLSRQIHDPSAASVSHIRKYLKRVSEVGMATATSARRLSVIRQFYRFLVEEGIREDDPSQSIASPRQKYSLPKYLSEDEVKLLLNTTRQREGPEGLRLTALLEILYATGLRVSELVALPMIAFDRDLRVLLVEGKGQKDRMIPLNDFASEALKDYLGFG